MAKSAELEDLLLQARITNRLLAAQLKNSMNQQELVGLLASTGATRHAMADVLNTTPATIAMTLKRLRRRGATQRERR
jgi:DNA-binding MarR family transcriptional regulator